MVTSFCLTRFPITSLDKWASGLRTITLNSRRRNAISAPRSTIFSRLTESARLIRSIASSARSFGTNAEWREIRVPGDGEDFNQALERAGRVADFLEFAELMCLDALARDESCGAHFRDEHQTSEGEALRDDENFADVFAWEFQGNPAMAGPKLHREPLHFETVHLTQRSYK